jgi:hypothetical protein
MFMSDWSTLMTPQKAAPGQDAYIFVIRILSMSSPQFQFSLSGAALGIYLHGQSSRGKIL